MKSWRDTPIANSASIPRFGILDCSAPPVNWRNTPIADAAALVVIPAAAGTSDEWSPEAREAAAKARAAKAKTPEEKHNAGPFEPGIGAFEGWLRNAFSAEERQKLSPARLKAMRKKFNEK